MGNKGGGSTTTTSSSLPPSVLQAYNTLIGQAGKVAQQPLNQYSGPLVAGFTPTQTNAFNTINNAQGIATPYINSAAQLTGTGATPINPQTVNAADIQQYMSPYTQNVVNATQAQLANQNAQQQQQLVGSAISSGAWGGDRAGVAQGILGGQQALAEAPTIAGLYNQGYTTALGEANTQQQAGIGAQEASGWLAENAGYGMGNLGNEALNSTLSGASAQLQAGGLQQQLQQEQLNIPYEQFTQAQAYPFQSTSWLSNIVEGLGGGQGGTSTTTTPDQGSTLGSLAGLGLTGLSLFGNRGGRMNASRAGFDAGGLVPDVSVSFIPDTKQQWNNQGSGVPRPPSATQHAGLAASTMDAINGFKGAKQAGLDARSGWDGLNSAISQWTAPAYGDLMPQSLMGAAGASDFVGGFKSGGRAGFDAGGSIFDYTQAPGHPGIFIPVLKAPALNGISSIQPPASTTSDYSPPPESSAPYVTVPWNFPLTPIGGAPTTPTPTSGAGSNTSSGNSQIGAGGNNNGVSGTVSGGPAGLANGPVGNAGFGDPNSTVGKVVSGLVNLAMPVPPSLAQAAAHAAGLVTDEAGFNATTGASPGTNGQTSVSQGYGYGLVPGVNSPSVGAGQAGGVGIGPGTGVGNTSGDTGSTGTAAGGAGTPFNHGGMAHDSMGGAVMPEHAGTGFDDGGAVQAGLMNAGVPMTGSMSPMASNMMQAYGSMSPEKLQEMSVMMPPTSPQGQMIQRLLQMRRMQPQGQPQPQAGLGAPQAPMGPAMTPGPTGGAGPSVQPPFQVPGGSGGLGAMRDGGRIHRYFGGPTPQSSPNGPTTQFSPGMVQVGSNGRAPIYAYPSNQPRPPMTPPTSPEQGTMDNPFRLNNDSPKMQAGPPAPGSIPIGTDLSKATFSQTPTQPSVPGVNPITQRPPTTSVPQPNNPTPQYSSGMTQAGSSGRTPLYAYPSNAIRAPMPVGPPVQTFRAFGGRAGFDDGGGIPGQNIAALMQQNNPPQDVDTMPWWAPTRPRIDLSPSIPYPHGDVPVSPPNMQGFAYPTVNQLMTAHNPPANIPPYAYVPPTDPRASMPVGRGISGLSPEPPQPGVGHEPTSVAVSAGGKKLTMNPASLGVPKVGDEPPEQAGLGETADSSIQRILDESKVDTGPKEEPQAQPAEPEKKGFLDRVNMPLLAAGLGILANPSTHPLQAIGQGALQGIKEYGAEKQRALAEKKEGAAETYQQGEIAARKKSYDIEAQRLSNELDYHRQQLSNETTRLADEKIYHEGMVNYGRYQWAPGTSKDESGQPIEGMWKLPTRGGEQPTFVPNATIAARSASAPPIERTYSRLKGIGVPDDEAWAVATGQLVKPATRDALIQTLKNNDIEILKLPEAEREKAATKLVDDRTASGSAAPPPKTGVAQSPVKPLTTTPGAFNPTGLQSATGPKGVKIYATPNGWVNADGTPYAP